MPFFQGKADFGELFPTVRTWCSKPNKVAEPNDILISVRAPVGATNICNVTACIGRGLAAIKPSEKVVQKYLLYYFRYFEPILSASGNGAIFSAITMSDLKEVQIPLPPLEVQKKIAAVLEKADELRLKREEQIKRLDDLLQATFLDMFGDPVTNPKGWPVKKLQDLLKDKKDLVDGPFGSSVNTQTDYIENGEIPVIRTKNVGLLCFKPEDLKFMTREKYETVKRSQVLPGDIVLTKVGTIGNLCLFPSVFEEAVLSTTGSCRIRPNKDALEPLFLLHYLYHYRPRMLEIASTAVQAFLNMNHIKNFDIFIPPADRQKRFGEVCNSITLKASKLENGSSRISSLFNSLMQRAFKGELELR